MSTVNKDLAALGLSHYHFQRLVSEFSGLNRAFYIDEGLGSEYYYYLSRYRKEKPPKSEEGRNRTPFLHARSSELRHPLPPTTFPPYFRTMNSL